MDAHLLSALTSAVLFLHFAVVLFNVLGLIVIPLGGWRGWPFVQIFWLRALHLVSLALVTLQALAGRACFLTLWQNDLASLSGGNGNEPPLIERIVTRAIFWPLPFWAFAVLYAAAFVGTLALWRLVPPRH
jgi:hypothetical protein